MNSRYKSFMGHVWQIFSHTLLFVFPLLSNIFQSTLVLNFDEDQLTNFLLRTVLLVSYLRNLCPIYSPKDFLLFSPRSFVLALKTIVPFEWALCMVWDKGYVLLFLLVDIQLPQHHLLNRVPFFQWPAFVPLFKKSINYKCKDLFLNRQFYLFIYMSMLVPHCLGSCSFILNYEIGKWKSSNSVFVFEIVLFYTFCNFIWNLKSHQFLQKGLLELSHSLSWIYS